MIDDYSEILGLEPEATPEQIKTAFRSLALKRQQAVKVRAASQEARRDNNDRIREILGEGADDQEGSGGKRR